MVNSNRIFLHVLRALLCILLIHSFATGLMAQDASVIPPKPEPAVYVHDYSGWLNPSQKFALEEKLRRYWDSTSTQIVVMIRPTLGDFDKAGYTVELGRKWGIGQKGKNNGIIVLVKTEAPDRGIFIATGYGAEGALPDILAGRIIRNTMGPYFRQQQYYAGIDAGVNDIIAAMKGEFKDDAASDEAPSLGAIIFIMIFVLLVGLFVLYIITKFGKNTPSRTARGMRNPNSGMGGMGGGWWIGGGGFGGGFGGGSSGGGSSDGGSFGGGDFGGGGAGGDW